MDQHARAARLITNTQYAAPIQVAVLIKQLLNAGSVAITQPHSSNTPELVWHEGDLPDANPDRTRHNDAPDGENTGVQRILQMVGRLYKSTESRYPVQQTRFATTADTHELEIGRPGHCRAIYWQTPWEQGPLCFLWFSQHPAGYTPQDKRRFHQIRPLASRLFEQTSGILPSQTQYQQCGKHESVWGRLSVMERKVLNLLKEGMTEAEVARSLHRSPHTIHVHVKGLYRKFLVHSRAELIKAAKSRPICPG